MDPNAKKEQVSFAYVRAVAAFAGIGFQEHPYDPDNDSVDVQFRVKTGRHVQLEAQLKCTACETVPDGVDSFTFDLPIKNYDDLRCEVLVPRVLIVVTLPLGEEEWCAHTEQELLLRRCGYYVSLAGSPASENKTTVRVRVPRANMLSPARLTDLMAKINSGEPL